MDKATLQWRANRLKAAAAMGGFVIMDDQAESAALGSEEDQRSGKSLSFEQARIEVRQLNPFLTGQT